MKSYARDTIIIFLKIFLVIMSNSFICIDIVRVLAYALDIKLFDIQINNGVDNMTLPSLKIGDLKASLPIIQGGMGIGVSLSRLAAAVANEGGIGIISGIQTGYKETDFKTNNLAANLRTIQREIRNARKLSPKGIIGINFLVAANNYKEMVQTAVKEKIDLIISGAGLPKELPSLVIGSKTKIAPIVSSGKAAKVITKLWDKKYNYIPDAVIVEGPNAGGHLGFSKDQLTSKPLPNLANILKDVLEALKPFEERYNKKIPVVAAGGIFTGKDIKTYLDHGASGVQMSTRFVATNECDADENFKKAYVNSSQEDIELIQSPVGLPGRAISNYFTKLIKANKLPVEKCYNCLKTCNPADTPYCISDALIRSVKGDANNGLIFCGSNAYRLDKIISVKQLVQNIKEEYKNS